MLNIAQVEKFRKLDPYLQQTLTQVIDAINSLARQVGADPVGVAAAPPSIAALSVTAANGQVNVQIVDQHPVNNSETTKTLRYFVEAATDPGFTNVVHTEYLGPARNKNFVLGNQTLYFRAYSQLQNSPASKPVVFGGSNPTAVTVGGSAAPAQQPYQGSGSSTTSGQGYGAPVRSTSRSTRWAAMMAPRPSQQIRLRQNPEQRQYQLSRPRWTRRTSRNSMRTPAPIPLAPPRCHRSRKPPRGSPSCHRHSNREDS